MALSLVSTHPRHGSRPSTVVGAAVVYLVMRAVSAVVLLLAQLRQPVIAGLDDRRYLGMTMHWDALWYRSIALHGYPHHLPVLVGGTIAQNRWAFFAGFPFVTRAVMQLTGAGFPLAATVVNLVAGTVAACAIASVLAIRIPRSATIAVVGVWAALPMAPTLQLAYSEALAMALLALALLWLVREHWGRATVAALLLGLTRPILPPLAIVYVVAAWRRWHRRRSEPLTSWEWSRMLGGLVLTVAGSALWPAIAWRYTGVPDAYSATEGAWHRHSEGLFAGLGTLQDQLGYGQHLATQLAIVTAICVAAVLTVLALRSPRLDPVLATWCATYLVYDLAVAKMHADELRMLLPLFPLVAVACGVASARLAPGWQVRAALLAGLGIVGQYAWVMQFVLVVPGLVHTPP